MPEEPSIGNSGASKDPDSGESVRPLSEEYRPVEPSVDDCPAVYEFSNPPSSWAEESVIRKVARQSADPGSSSGRSRRELGFAVYCNLLIFVTSLCVMVLELAASRLIARHLGSSLYTWTSVIGVVLSGITIGNYAGGILADRFDRTRLLPLLFFLASLLSLSVLWMDQLAEGQVRPHGWSWGSWVLLIVSECYFLPSMALGTISPVVAMLALSRAKQRGRVLGSVYAWAACGSIAGTFLTGFILIDLFGTRAIISIVSLTLALLSALTARRWWSWRIAVVLGWMQLSTIVFLMAVATGKGFGVGCYRIASAFYGLSMVEQVKLLSESEQMVLLDRIANRWGNWFELQTSSRLALLHQKDRDFKAASLLADCLDELGPSDHVEMMQWEELNLPNSALQRWVGSGMAAGHNLHELGLLIGLRDDWPNEYDDESRYSRITVVPDETHGGDVLALQLDKLVHSFFSPSAPETLFYEYEQIYAAVTELGLEQTQVEWSIPVGNEIDLDEWREDPGRGFGALPEWIRLDSGNRSLQIQGELTPTRRKQLLDRMPTASFWTVLGELLELSSGPDWPGYAALDLDRLPPDCEWPLSNDRRIVFDQRIEKLVAYEPLDEAIYQKLISAAPHAAYHRFVQNLSSTDSGLRALFLGGGGFVFPRWIESRFPSAAAIDVIEIDPDVIKAVRQELGLRPVSRTRVQPITGDARAVVDRMLIRNGRSGDDQRYDLIYGDAFNDFNVPWHLTTREFAEKVKRLLTSDGVYLVNLIDTYPRTVFERSEVVPVELKYIGPLPTIWQEKVLANRWQAVTNPAAFEVLHESRGVYRLRYTGYLKERTLDSLKQQAGLVPLESALDRLHVLSQSARLIEDVPDDWLGQVRGADEWLPVNGIPGLEIRRGTDSGTGVMLSCRGRLTDTTLQRLNAVLPNHPGLKPVVDQLQKESSDPDTGRFLARFVATVNRVFPQVLVFSTVKGTPSDTRDTFVIVCSTRPLDCSRMARSPHWQGMPFAWSGQEAFGGFENQWDPLLDLSDGFLLTDDYAPVENLLAPVLSVGK